MDDRIMKQALIVINIQLRIQLRFFLYQ
jgi:hypothetical protein